MPKYILFDLDGTLTDPMMGITNSIMYALQKMGRDIPSRQSLCCFIGPPLIPAFKEFLGMTNDEANEALRLYREYFSVYGLYENTIYPGIDAALAKLKSAGKTLALATSKPEKFARKILDHFSLSEYFTVICGADLEGLRASKTDVMRYTLEMLGNPDLLQTIMVGDRHHDIDGAKECGCASVGVLWGYGSEEELKNAGADKILSSIEEMTEMLMNM